MYYQKNMKKKKTKLKFMDIQNGWLPEPRVQGLAKWVKGIKTYRFTVRELIILGDVMYTMVTIVNNTVF